MLDVNVEYYVKRFLGLLQASLCTAALTSHSAETQSLFRKIMLH